MNFANINYVWSNLLIEELVRNGIEQFVISPGSRNSPLVLAAAGNRKAKTSVHFDERGAAFFALGTAKSAGKPSVLISTSGTAAANYLPAITEANLASLPLIVLTADRPIELRDSGAHQTMKQTDLYGQHVKWSFDLPAPTTEIEANFVLTTVDLAVYQSLRPPAGPVQLNCQFREPLTPEVGSEDFTNYLSPLQNWLNGKKPFTGYQHSVFSTPAQDLKDIFAELKSSQHGLVIIGPLHPYSSKENIYSFISQLNWPVFIDIASGLRFGGCFKNVFIHYEYFLRSEKFLNKVKPDFILHLGGLPRAKVLNNFIKTSGAKYLCVQNTPFRQDPFHQIDFRIEMAPERFCEILLKQKIQMKSSLLLDIQKAERIAANKLAHFLSCAENCFELAVIRGIVETIPADDNLFLANSMPIRDADACGICRSDKIHVGVNFGVNGIDGTMASAAGFATGNQKSTTVILGDLAFLHDLNSLQLAKHSKAPIIAVVLNNNGGGIFSFLPVADYQDFFENYFGTPHNLSFEGAANFFELSYSNPQNLSEFLSTYKNALGSKQSWIIEIKNDRATNYKAHQKIWSEIIKAIDFDLQWELPNRPGKI